MNKGQAIADLSLELSAVTTAERAQEIIQRALRTTGLSNAPVIDAASMDSLLQAIAAEGGAVQEIAEQIAVQGLTGTDGISTDQDAA
ncbi:MAG: hypothetical protein V3R95_00865 [Dehalococcoidia bacterium]